MTSPVWFITGSSSGFGAALTLNALKSGHRVIATSRNPSQAPAHLVAEVKELGGQWQSLDITASESEISKAVEKATTVYGRIDILANVAGYALLGGFETMRLSFTPKSQWEAANKLSDEECRAQMNTNFFGPLTLVRQVLPGMRKRGSGTIINFSSTAGLEARPSRSLYSASKFALEAASEALFAEVGPLGIRIIIVSPGGFKSNFASSIVTPAAELPDEYKGTVIDKTMEMIKGGTAFAKLPGDVEKGAKLVFEVVMRTGTAEGMEDFLRIPLGKDGIDRWRVKIAGLQNTIDGTERIWSSTDLSS